MNVRSKPPRWAVLLSRDSIIFVLGLAGITHETLVTTTERPYLLVVFGAMIGLPAALRFDESRRNNNGKAPPSSPPES